MPAHPISAILLAAGSSERMESQNKLLLEFRRKPLVAHVAETLLSAGLLEVVVVLGYEAKLVSEVLNGLPVTLTVNERYPEGMTTSIHAGVTAARLDAAGHMICLADLPLIEAEEFDFLARAFAKALREDHRSIIVPFHHGERGNPVIFPAHYRGEILAHRGLTGCRGLVKHHRDHVVEVEMEKDHILVDIDTPEAYRALHG